MLIAILVILLLILCGVAGIRNDNEEIIQQAKRIEARMGLTRKEIEALNKEEEKREERRIQREYGQDRQGEEQGQRPLFSPHP